MVVHTISQCIRNSGTNIMHYENIVASMILTSVLNWKTEGKGKKSEGKISTFMYASLSLLSE